MAIKDVLRMGNPILRLKAKPVSLEEIRSDTFKNLIEDMFETMEAEDGIGIAAPQIGISKQVAIIGVPRNNPRYPEIESTEIADESEDEEEKDYEIIVVINPKITVLDEEKLGFWEGCLSVPGLRGFVERPKKIRVDYLDLDGKEVSREADGFDAIVFQHEIDHLEGFLYLDRVTDTTKISYIEEYLEHFESKN